MMLVMTNTSDSYVQFITVLVIFVLVLGVTALTTKWIANYQKQQNVNCNIEVIETTRIANNKYIQIVRVGDTYKAVAVCKDTVTLLGEVPKEQLREMKNGQTGMNFRELFDKAMKKDSSNDSEPKE